MEIAWMIVIRSICYELNKNHTHNRKNEYRTSILILWHYRNLNSSTDHRCKQTFKLLRVNHSFLRYPIWAPLAPISEKLHEELNIGWDQVASISAFIPHFSLSWYYQAVNEERWVIFMAVIVAQIIYVARSRQWMTSRIDFLPESH